MNNKMIVVDAKTITIRGCRDNGSYKGCPSFWSNTEFPEFRCQVIDRDFGWHNPAPGEPPPEWCPLRKKPVLLKIKRGV